MKSVLEQIGCLSDIHWKEMKLHDNFKNVDYEVVNKQRWLKRENVCNYTIAFDVETFEGTCKLIADSNERYILNPSFEDCLRFLMYYAKNSGGYRFFYNIDFDISAILKLWNNVEAIDMLRKGIMIEYKAYRMKWLKGKFFLLRKGKNTVRFTDLFNFFKIGLNKASKTYLKEIEKDKIDGNLLNTSLRYWNENERDIIKYCIKDCIITRELAQLLIDSLIEAKISLPKLLVSSGSLAKQDFRMNCRMNNLSNIPREIVQISYDCYFGGKFEIQKQGYFEQGYLSDINSEYPNFLKELYDLKFGVWQEIDYLPLQESFGYFKVDLDIPENIDISTIPLKLESGIILTVCGIIKNRWLTWYDLDLMRKYITKFHKGYIFIPTISENEGSKEQLKYIKPFKERILYHYNKKNEYKGIKDKKMMYNIHKLTMNALYGSFIERHESIDVDGNKHYSVGILFNPIYASQTTSYGRWIVIKDIPKRKWKYVLAIHTDSILSSIPLKELKYSNEIGDWTLEKSGKTIILNTGMYQIKDLVKNRGIPKRYIKNWLRFCLENKNQQKCTFEIPHMRKISESLIRDKSLINLNTITSETRSVCINADVKRHWKSEFRDFKDVISKQIESKLWYFVYDFDKDIINNVDFLERLYQNPLLT